MPSIMHTQKRNRTSAIVHEGNLVFKAYREPTEKLWQRLTTPCHEPSSGLQNWWCLKAEIYDKGTGSVLPLLWVMSSGKHPISELLQRPCHVCSSPTLSKHFFLASFSSPNLITKASIVQTIRSLFVLLKSHETWRRAVNLHDRITVRLKRF